MTKAIILFLALLLNSELYSQVPKNYVTLEGSTGTWCSGCPSVAAIFDDLHASGKKLALIHNHSNDEFANTDSQFRNLFNEVTWYPQSFFDGESIPYNDWNNVTVFNSMYDTAIAELSPFQITFEAIETGGVINLTGAVTKVSPISDTNLRLHIVITESHVLYNNFAEKNFINRKMIPSSFGTELDFSSSTTHSFNESITLNADWNNANLNIIVFAQSNDTKRIYQTNQSNIQYAEINENDRLTAQVYPNPVANQLTIESSQMYLIELADISGKMILRQDANNKEKIILDISSYDLQPGSYFLKIINKQDRSIVKHIRLK